VTTTFVIARHELRRIFVSPLAWAVLAVVQLIFGFVFYNVLIDYVRNAELGDQFTGVADYIGGALYGFATIVLLLVMPLMTMRLFSEERKSGSLTLLLSSPASLTEIVLGKFLGLVGFMLALLDLDLGRIGAGLLGLLLIMLAFGSAGMFVSSLTREPTIAAVGGFGLLLLVWLTQILAYQEIPLAELFGYLSLIGHYDDLRRGIFDTGDVAYYLLFTALFLWLTVQRLDLERA
jgi:ABC-2 type transport system permease protein